MDDLRFRTQQSPRNEPPMNTFVSPPRNGTRLPQPVSSHDQQRANLPRRFTADSARVPTLSNIGNARGQEQPPPPQDYTATYHKVQLLEKKKQEYEMIREQKRLFEAELQKHEQELVAMQEDLRGPMSGHQSEPTTPPEYRETSSGFPTMFSRPNRYSTSSLVSPPGLFNRVGRSGSQLASPAPGLLQNRFESDAHLPSWSVPGSRRNSDDEDKEEAVRQDPTSHRATNALNRYSMPVTRTRNPNFAEFGDLDATKTTRFLFGDDDTSESKLTVGSTPDDNFPTLMHNLSIGSGQLNGAGSTRHSLDLKYLGEATNESSNAMHPASTSHILATPPKLQSSYSAGDVPTVKSGATQSFGLSTNNHAEQHLQNHNASLGRIPAGAMANRHSRDLSSDTANAAVRDQSGAYQSMQSALQGSAAPFGPGMVAPVHGQLGAAGPPGPSQVVNPVNYTPYYSQSSYSGGGPPSTSGVFGVPLLSMGMSNLNLGNNYSSGSYTGGYGSVGSYGSPQRDSQARVIQSRRQQDNEAMARYQNLPLEAVVGRIYELCKDQHGCRYLQKKLEDGNAEHIHMIWLETNAHVIELMTDPFGNYLCQKLLEYSDDGERTALVRNAAPDMVKIALNQHGTRALQKMIEFITTPEQTQIVIEALRNRVVELIQDLNGNHVIQKCLNKLSAPDAQFIFDAVGSNCIEVGTHRHGCCVLQRCIDHANPDQRVWLIAQITKHANVLVQDPYGNYVIQYIIDLNEPAYTEPVVDQFRGHVSTLSRHKFSSNVIEKCLRCAQEPSKDLIVDEVLAPGEIEKLIRDNYANYVIQTALEYASFAKKTALIEAIRPVLPSVRSTPYGRRIQAKIHAFDGRTSGQATPADTTGGQIPLRAMHSRGSSNSNIQPGGPPPHGYGSNPNNLMGANGMARGGMMGPVAPGMPPPRNVQGAFPVGPSMPGNALSMNNVMPGNMVPPGPPGPSGPHGRMVGQFDYPRAGHPTGPVDNGESQWL